MVIRLSTETEEPFSDLKSELDEVQAHDIRSSFYYSWASQSILYKNISVTFEPRLSTAKIVKITAVYGKSFILFIRIIYPRYLLILECPPFRIYIYILWFIGELTLSGGVWQTCSTSTPSGQLTYCHRCRSATCKQLICFLSIRGDA
jgi:hypothetical protein